jgi:hypothetical protein
MPTRAPERAPFHPHSVVAARRRGRAAFGMVLATGVIVVPLAAVGLTFARAGGGGLLGRQVAGLGIPALFALATAAYLLRWALGAVSVRLSRAVSHRGRAIASPAAAGAAFGHELAVAKRLERVSVTWPAFGLGMVAPLASHSAIAALFGTGAADIGDWVRISIFVVGLAHLVFAGMLMREAQRMVDDLDGWRLGRATGRVVGWSTLAGCVPGIVALGVPPLLVAITGSILAPLILAGLHDRLKTERAMLDPAFMLSRRQRKKRAATVTVAA